MLLHPVEPNPGVCHSHSGRLEGTPESCGQHSLLSGPASSSKWRSEARKEGVCALWLSLLSLSSVVSALWALPAPPSCPLLSLARRPHDQPGSEALGAAKSGVEGKHEPRTHP